MIVDDEPLEREVLTMIIQKEQLGIQQLIEATNGVEAVQLASEKQVDLVLMDIEMPMMDGVTAAQLIQQARPQCDIIFFTANHHVDVTTNECLLKPVHPKEIVAALAKYMPATIQRVTSPLHIHEHCTHPDIIALMAYIQAHIHEPLTLDHLAARVHFNGQYLSRLFKQQTSYTITQYITACRLEKAKHYLRYSSDETVADISQKCGFIDGNYFARVFKKYEGISPSQYQQQMHINRKKRMNTFNNFLM
jgi:two-component system, response regulator YesN